MTFKQLQDAVLTDRFSESKRSQVKDWINARYGRVWAREPWSFKLVVTPVTLAANATSVSKGNLQRVIRIWDGSTDRNGAYLNLEAIAPQDFYEYANQTSLGYPNDVTVVGGNIVADRKATTARTLYVLGEQKFVPLDADGDVPLIPAEFHYMLVHGAASEGLRIENDPTWQGFEQDFQGYYEDLKRAYLTEILGAVAHYPAWSPMAPDWY